MKIWDISVPITPTLPTWPGDPRVALHRISDKDLGDEANVSHLACCVHTGTHVDAPCHFLTHGSPVEELPLNLLVGPVQVVELSQVERGITPQHLDALSLPDDTMRLLFKTRNSAFWDDPQHEFQPDFVALTSDAASWIIEHGIELVGVDYLSVQLFDDSSPLTHQRLLGAGVILVEGLDLRAVSAGRYYLVCLPLKLVGSDGAPARAILMREEEEEESDV
jgi:arylformamidase